MNRWMITDEQNELLFFQVNTKAAGKSALHCASVAGNTAILKCLLEFNPDLEIEVNNCDHVIIM